MSTADVVTTEHCVVCGKIKSISRNYQGAFYASEWCSCPKVPKEEGVLKGGDMLWLRRMVREEYRAELERALDQAVERFFARGLDNLMTAIKEPRDEQEEIAAVLATLTTEQLEAVIVRVRESQQS